MANKKYQQEYMKINIKKVYSTATASDGTCSELSISIDLIKKGYLIYRNISPYGPFDIVAYKDNTLLKIEITEGTINQKTGHRYFPLHKKYNHIWDIIAVIYSDMIIYYDRNYNVYSIN